MSHHRPRRDAAEITRAIARVQAETRVPFERFVGRMLVVGDLVVKVSAVLLVRWAQEGKAGEGGRVWLDAIKQRGTWFTSEAAVTRFLRELGAVPVG